MDVFKASYVARILLPDLCGLIQARKQAVLQRRDCAGEYKHYWTQVIDAIDVQIAAKERKIAERMGLLKFRAKEGVRICGKVG